MRFLHAADLHLDSPLRSQALRNPDLAARLHAASRSALARIVDAAIDHKVDALLLAGDVFDSGVVDLTSRAALAAEMGRLARAGIPAALIRGNHDALLDFARYGPIADNVTLLDADAPTLRIGDASIHGLGFSTRHVTSSMLPLYPQPEPGRINVGLMHTSLGGSAGHDRYAPCAEADLLAHGYEYWALGHIHQRFERRSDTSLAVMPGIPQGRSIRETGAGTATLVDIDLNGIRATEVPIALLRFVRQGVDLGGADSQAAVIDILSQTLQSARQDDCDIALRLDLQGGDTLTGDPAFARTLADEAAQGISGVYVEAVRLAPGQTRTPPGTLADLAAIMAQDIATPGFRDEATALLAEWQKALPRDIADTLAPDQLDDLMQQGLDIALARLTGGAPDA